MKNQSNICSNVKDVDLEILEFLKKVPKTEVHLHIEACVSQKILLELIEKNKLNIKKEDLLKKYDFSSLDQFIDLFLFIQSLFQKEEDLNYMILGLKEYMIKQRIIYAEVFFSPTRFVQKGFSFQRIVEILVNGIRELKKKYNLEVKLILDVSRTFGVENAESNLENLIKYKQKEIIGIGMGGAERNNPSKDYSEVFQKAKDEGLKTVVHAGEDLGPEEVWNSIKYLKPHRIGHAVTASLDERLMDYLSEHQIPIEVCLSSNVLITDLVKEYEDHPIRKFYDKNMLVCINTDDPEIFQTDLINEYFKVYKHLGFDLEELTQLLRNGLKSIFNLEKNFMLDSFEHEVKNIKKTININKR